MKEGTQQDSLLRSSLSGCIAGIGQTYSAHPLDTIKVKRPKKLYDNVFFLRSVVFLHLRPLLKHAYKCLLQL